MKGGVINWVITYCTPHHCCYVCIEHIKQELLVAIGLGTDRTSGLRVLPAGKMKLKEQSRPYVSKLTSTDVRLATKLGRGQLCDVIGSLHEFRLRDVTDYTPEMVQPLTLLKGTHHRSKFH